MIHINGSDDHTPTHALASAINHANPTLTTTHNPNRADLTITPRHTLNGPGHATPDAWYDLTWTHPVLTTDDDGNPITGTRTLGHAGTLPAPPVIAAQQRIAAAAPVTLDGLTERQIEMYGGEEAVRKILTDRRDSGILHDRSTAAFDWDALAATAIATISGLTAPKLTPGQRAQAAAARLHEHLQRLDDLRVSVRHLIANAEHAGDTDDLDTLRDVLDAADPHWSAPVEAAAR